MIQALLYGATEELGPNLSLCVLSLNKYLVCVFFLKKSLFKTLLLLIFETYRFFTAFSAY